jgi:hypothetical protein
VAAFDATRAAEAAGFVCAARFARATARAAFDQNWTSLRA